MGDETLLLPIVGRLDRPMDPIKECGRETKVVPGGVRNCSGEPTNTLGSALERNRSTGRREGISTKEGVKRDDDELALLRDISEVVSTTSPAQSC